jgi:hypothetical protein
MNTNPGARWANVWTCETKSGALSPSDPRSGTGSAGHPPQAGEARAPSLLPASTGSGIPVPPQSAGGQTL